MAASRAVCSRVGDDDGENVTQIGRAATFRDEHRPVGVDDPDARIARHVGGGEHRRDAGHGAGAHGVDPHDVGPGVIGEPERPVQHARDAQVVDIAAVAERECGGRRRHACPTLRAADRVAAGWVARRRAARRRRGSSCTRCSGTGGHRGARRLVAGGRRLSCRSAPSGGRRSPACRSRTAGRRSREGGRVATPLGGVEAFQGRDGVTCRLVQGYQATHRRLAVDEHRAAAALAPRGAAVLGDVTPTPHAARQEGGDDRRLPPAFHSA